MNKYRFIYLVVFIILFYPLLMNGNNSLTAGNIIKDTDVIYGSAWNEATGETESLKLDVYRPEQEIQGQSPVIILVHGGGFGGGTKGYSVAQGNFYPDVATAFANAGYVAFSIDYRAWPNMPRDKYETELNNTVEDVITALNWIKVNFDTYGIDTTRVIIGGDSAGGGIVVNASYREENKGFFKGCIDLWGGIPPYGETPVNACPVTATVPPTCFINGTADNLIPYTDTENLSRELNNAGVYNELHPLDGLVHYPVNHSTEPDGYQTDLVNEIIEMMLSFSGKVLRNRINN